MLASWIAQHQVIDVTPPDKDKSQSQHDCYMLA